MRWFVLAVSNKAQVTFDFHCTFYALYTLYLHTTNPSHCPESIQLAMTTNQHLNVLNM